jgi:uncharacterized protein DUF3306
VNTEDSSAKPFSLRRWSQRKLAAARKSRSAAASEAEAPAGDTRASPAEPPIRGDQRGSAPGERSTGAPAAASGERSTGALAVAPGDVTANPAAATEGGAPIQSIGSLSIDSDFSAYLGPSVDPALKRAALKQLFRDPRFNVMDGLDVYIDDYTKSDPIPPDLVKQMVQGRYIFDPPKTRVTDAGNVEDVPLDPVGEEVPRPDAPAPVAVAGQTGDPPVPVALVPQAVEPPMSSSFPAQSAGEPGAQPAANPQDDGGARPVSDDGRERPPEAAGKLAR